jgi:hypothetical protein
MRNLIIIFLASIFCFGANLARAPKVEPKPIIGNYDPRLKPLPPLHTGYDQNIIYSIPDFRSTAGSAGKNIIFADDGQNVAVIYNRFSGDTNNIMQVWTAYSTDRGWNWIHYGPLSTFNARRTCPGLDAEPNWPGPADMRIHYTWNQAARYGGSYDSSPCFYAKEVMYPDGLITGAFSIPNSGTWDVWYPCIAVKDSIVVITGVNGGQWFSGNSYIWRSTDYGETWDDGRLFFQGPLEWMGGPHFRFGSDGYMFFLWNRQQESNPDLYWPYYCESFDYGVTWTQPQLIWQDNPPYADMSNVTGWWYDYDCDVVNDTPVATVKLATIGNDYGEIWAYRPDSGGPGNWRFSGTKLVGAGVDTSVPLPYARYPTIAADERGNIIIGYQAHFIISEDTVWDCGVFTRPYRLNTWLDFGRVTLNGNAIAESYLEFAYNAKYGYFPGLRWGDTIAMIYNDAGEYPVTGNLYFEIGLAIYPGIAETDATPLNRFEVLVSPNPFHNLLKFILPSNFSKVTLSIFDINGKLVTNLKPPVTNNYFVWDGRRANGDKVNAGIYFYTATSGNNIYQGKIILTR